MSKKEYSFHKSNQRTNNTNPMLDTAQKNSDESISTSNTKQIILGEYNKFIDLKINDPQIKYLSETQENISKEIVNTTGTLQKIEGKDNVNQLVEKLNHLTTLHNKLKNEYTILLKTKLEILYNNWPGLFDRLIEGIDKETLENVLNVFEDYSKGKLKADQAVNKGIDFMQTKYKLPKDFFDRNAVSEFNKNLHKTQ